MVIQNDDFCNYIHAIVSGVFVNVEHIFFCMMTFIYILLVQESKQVMLHMRMRAIYNLSYSISELQTRVKPNTNHSNPTYKDITVDFSLNCLQFVNKKYDYHIFR